MLTGWCKAHRSITGWRWYKNVNARITYQHLMLTVNYEQAEWGNVVIKPGQRVVDLRSLAKEVGISLQQLRTALGKLKSTNDIDMQSTNTYTIFTVTNWAETQCVENNDQHTENALYAKNQHTEIQSYPQKNKPKNNTLNNFIHKEEIEHQQTDNTRATHIKEYKEEKKVVGIDIANALSIPSSIEKNPEKEPELFQDLEPEKMAEPEKPKTKRDLSWMLNLWNVKMDAKITQFDDRRRSKCDKLLKRLSKEYGLSEGEAWQRYCDTIASSDYLCGKVVAWKATFDWILEPRNTTKILEDNYGNNNRKQQFTQLRGNPTTLFGNPDSPIFRKSSEIEYRVPEGWNN